MQNLLVEYYKFVGLNMPKQTRQKYLQWIQQNGKNFKGTKLTEPELQQLKKLAPKRLFTPKQCVYQSQMIAVTNREYKYFEGQATNKGIENFPFEHAWLIKNDKVIDATWKDGLEYFGFHIPTEFIVKNMLATGMAEFVLPKYIHKILEG